MSNIIEFPTNDDYIEVPLAEFEKSPLGWKWVKSAGGILTPEHLIQISEHLELLARGEGPRILLVAAPPGHGKSELISRDFPCWYFDQEEFLENRIGLISYAAGYAVEWGRKVRNQLEEYGKHKLAQDSKAASRWNIQGHDGGMYATGVGGIITGRRLKLLIMDDLIKNNADAISKTKSQALWDWILATALDRLEPDAGIVIAMQRWTENDPIGRMIRKCEKEKIEYTLLSFRATAKENDRCGRAPGEALWPERFDEKALDEKRRMLGSLWYNAKYEQEPRKLSEEQPDPAWFKKRNFSEIAAVKGSPSITSLVRYVDMAAKTEKTKDEGDYLAGVLSCKSIDRRYGILHGMRARKVSADVEELLFDLVQYDYKMFIRLGFDPKLFITRYVFWFESDKGGTGDLGASYIARMLADKLERHGIPVPQILYEHPTGSKVSRADPMFVQAKDGNYWILDESWRMVSPKYEETDVDDFLERICSGIDTGIDDEMDATSGGFSKMYSALQKIDYDKEDDPTRKRPATKSYPQAGVDLQRAVIRRANLFKRR